MPTDTDLLPDHVWQQLDPRAGQLAPGARRRARRSLLVAALVGASFLVTWQSGAVLPRVTTGENGNGMMADGLHHQFMETVEIRNSGWTSMTLEGIGRNGPGLRLVAVDGTFPTVLAPSTGQVFSLTYDVTDCGAVPQGEWAIPVRIDRPWGVWSSWVRPQPFVPMGTNVPSMRSYSGRDPYAKEWQAALATTACTPPPVASDPPGNAG